jgi:hypothetical protein
MTYIAREPLLTKAKELQGDVFGSPRIVGEIERAHSEAVAPVEEVITKLVEELFRYTESIGECTVDSPLGPTLSVVYESDIYRAAEVVQEWYNAKKDT